MLCAFGAMAQMPQIYHKHPRYYYSKWYTDSCPEYYNSTQCTRYWFHEGSFYQNSKIRVKDEFTPQPLLVKGLVALVNMHERGNAKGRLPEHLYLFQKIGDTRVIVDSVRWDTAAPMIINWKLNSHDSSYRQCYAYEAYFDSPYIVDSTFCIGGTTHSTDYHYIPELGYRWDGWYLHTHYVFAYEDTCWAYPTLNCMPYGEQYTLQLNTGVWNAISSELLVGAYGLYLAISDFYNLAVGTCDSTMGHVEGGGRMSDGIVRSITAVREPGYHFTYWNDGSRDNPRQVTLTQDTLFIACFAAGDPVPCNVTATAADSAMGIVTGSGVYDSNTVVTLRASGRQRCRFVQWNDGNTDNPRDVLVVRDTAFTAYFEPTDTARYLVEVLSADSLMGVVTGYGVYDSSSVATIEAYGLGNHEFSRWNDGNRNNPRQVVVTGDTVFTAYFKYIGAPESINEADASRVELSPNPTTGTVRITATEPMRQVTIYDLSGKQIQNSDHQTPITEHTLDLSSLPAGSYIIKITNIIGNTCHLKLIKN